jgi:hypothetical protein
MPAYNFKKQFAPQVAAGLKRCTIRAERKDGRTPSAKVEATLYTGMRSKACRCLRTVYIRRVRTVTMEFRRDGNTIIHLGGEFLSQEEMRKLALRDGFSSLAEMRGFFRETHGDRFSGHLIEW